MLIEEGLNKQGGSVSIGRGGGSSAWDIFLEELGVRSYIDKNRKRRRKIMETGSPKQGNSESYIQVEYTVHRLGSRCVWTPSTMLLKCKSKYNT